MQLMTALKKFGLVERFQAIATPETPSEAVVAWCKKQPELAEVVYPPLIRHVRRELGCPASRGGIRPPRGKGTSVKSPCYVCRPRKVVAA